LFALWVLVGSDQLHDERIDTTFDTTQGATRRNG
jgi:hypothetical protein